MYKFFSITLALSFAFCWGELKSQTLTILGEKIDCILPSYEGVALIKAVEHSPSLSSGIPDISIPLFSIKKSPLQVALSYNASGLLVDELPTTVGLGWRLEVGGMITRVVQGFPDDYPHYGYLKRGNTVESLSSKVLNQYTAGDIAAFTSSIDPATYDDSPDIFYYEVLGIKGKFVLSSDGSVVCFPRNNVGITYNTSADGSISSFRIKLADGMEVFFYGVETCQISGYSSISTPFNSSWFISHIKNLNQVVLSYNYLPRTGTGINYLNYKERRFAYDKEVLNSSGSSVKSTVEYGAQFSCPVLSAIKTTDATLSILYNTKDTVSFAELVGTNNYWPYVSTIRLTYKIMDNAPGIVSEFKSPQVRLTFDTPSGTLPYSKGNFQLTSLNVGVVANSYLPYVFDYYPGVIPEVRSKARDLWGYHNGASNSSIIPNLYWRNGKITLFETGNTGACRSGYNRSSSLTYAQSGNLKEMSNPDGLRVEYSYELNNFVFDGVTIVGGGLRIQSVKQYDESGTLLGQDSYSYNQAGTTTSGQLLSYSLGFTGMLQSDDPIVTNTWNGKNIYIKSPYCGFGSIPVGAAVFYTTVTTTKNGLGKTVYNYTMPVERGNSSIIPADLQWSLSGVNQYQLMNGYNSLVIWNDSYASSPSVFNLWSIPLLTRVRDYSQTGVLVRDITMNYGALEVTRLVSSMRLLPTFKYVYTSPSRTDYIYHATKTYMIGAWRELTSQTEKVYTPSGALSATRTKTFSYTRPLDGSQFSFVKRISEAAGGESTITRMLYCFEPDFDYSETALIQDYYTQLRNCLDLISSNGDTDCLEPTTVGNPTYEQQQCYNAFDAKVENLVDPEVKAITLLKEQENYSNPIMVTTMQERVGKKMVIKSAYSSYLEQPNKIVYPVSSYELRYPVDSSSFRGIWIQSGGLFSDPAYMRTNTVTLYNERGNVLETLGADSVYSANVWDSTGNYSILNAVNCRYSDVQTYNGQDASEESSIRSSLPAASVITRKHMYPLGAISETDARGRTNYFIYNTLGSMVALKDHDHNLRKLNLMRKKMQVGDYDIVPDTDPDRDLFLLSESVEPTLYIQLNANSFDMSMPVTGYVNYKSAYDYTINYGDGTVETLSKISFSHKYNTVGTYKISVICKRLDNAQVETASSENFTIFKSSPRVNYEYRGVPIGQPLSSEVSYSNCPAIGELIRIRVTPTYGTGNYSVVWTVKIKAPGATAYTTQTITQRLSPGGSTSEKHFGPDGTYQVTCTVKDGLTNPVIVETKTWNFEIGDTSGWE